MCAYEYMSECLYASQRGGGLCFDSIRCTGFNLPPLQLSLQVMHRSYEKGAETETKREKNISE